MDALALFNREQTKTGLQADAVAMTAGLLKDFVDGEIGDGYVYDTESGSVERYMIAGGGPSAWATFVTIDDTVTGFVEYADAAGSALVPLPDRDVVALRDALAGW